MAAAVVHRKAGRERIRNEREAVAATRHQEEAACYQRFAVEDCLREVRATAQRAEGRLRTQELELNDAERRQKATDRLRAIDEKKKTLPNAPHAGKRSEGAVREARGIAARKVPADPQSVKAQRDQEAAQRAQEQRQRLQTHTSRQAGRAAANAANASKARERQARTLKAADERRARVKQSSADTAAPVRQRAAPLPLPTFPASPASPASTNLQ